MDEFVCEVCREAKPASQEINLVIAGQEVVVCLECSEVVHGVRERER